LSLSYIIAILRLRLITFFTETGLLMALAIFDLDNTLIAGDSDHSWGQFLVAQGRVDQSHYQTMNDRFYADYEAGCLDIHAYLEFSLAPLATLSASDLETLHLEFMEQVIAPMRLALADRLVEKHRADGDRLLVITSTNRFIVEPICQSLGLSETLATEPEMVDGRYTGRIVGIPTYQEGKVKCLDLWLRENNETLDGSYFYSDSINDMPLLLKVTHPVAVDPDPQLRAEAVNRGWDSISLR
jgi:HAD superfamily hydrolase (TIGR01490 family)